MNGKAELRRHYRKVRLAHQREGDKIGRSVLPLIEQSISGSGHVGLFWPLSGEVDLRWLRERLPSQLGLPVADGSGGLQYRCWSDAPLQPDSCGIPAPAHGSPLGPDQLELLLVPALAVDQQGIRLGYGGGYYDRTLAALRKEGQITTVGIAYAGQEIAHVPMTKNDEYLDWIATETGVRKLGT